MNKSITSIELINFNTGIKGYRIDYYVKSDKDYQVTVMLKKNALECIIEEKRAEYIMDNGSPLIETVKFIFTREWSQTKNPKFWSYRVLNPSYFSMMTFIKEIK